MKVNSKIEEKFESPASKDWEQRRYEIAREMLPYAAETSRSILMSGHSLGDDAKGKTLAEVCASSAVSFADALIAELRKQPNTETKPEKQPDKKEIAIGEVVEYQGEHLLCVEKTDNEDCSGCAFLAGDDDCKFSVYCCKEFRSDGKNVIFLKGGNSSLEAINEVKVNNSNSTNGVPFDYENANIQQKDFAPKQEPKFQNGQWIVWQNKCYKVNYNGCGYELIDQNGLRTSLEYGIVDKNARLWTIQDSKDGDVLYSIDSKQPFIYKERPQFSQARGYCCINKFGEFAIWNTSKCVICTDKYIPATKEQRELLFKKIAEEGYEWHADKKELKKLSNEDEEIRKAIIHILKGKINYTSKEDTDKYIAWLKSLEQRIGE